MNYQKEHSKLPVEDHRFVSEIARMGYTVAINYTRHGAEYLATTYPSAWLEEYDEGSYQWFDPILVSSVIRTGDRRWSSVSLPDPMGVMAAAAKYGLLFGATFTRKNGRGRTLFSVARSDRDINESELLSLSAWITEFSSKYNQAPTIKKIYLDALRYQQQGIFLKQAAALEKISEPAMKARLFRARDFLGAKTTTEAVVIAMKSKLL